MTFSILALDRDSGAIGGAAATGSLCVGGWVLRGHPTAGMSASQGASPSTIWGEDMLAEMSSGLPAKTALDKIVSRDPGRSFRQLTGLDLTGRTAAFTGNDNEDDKGAFAFKDGIAAGNMLASAEVLSALAEGFLAASGPFDARLLAGLSAADRAGGDFRGLQSAALLVLHPARAPLTLRVDSSDDPLAALGKLHKKATSGAYADWARQVPTLSDPGRILA